MNRLNTDRAALAEALATTGYTVDDTQPEIVEPDTLLIESVTYRPGRVFDSIEATYRLTAVIDASTAAEALTEHARLAASLTDALTTTGAADLTEIGALYNLSDAAGNIYPACDIELRSTIERN